MDRDNHSENVLLRLLERLFDIAPAALDLVLSQAADLIGVATHAAKVDAFLYDSSSNTLVAVGSNHTELARQQRDLGLDRLAIANEDPMALVYLTGKPYHHGHIDQDDQQPRGVVEQLGICSMVAVALDVAGTRRGVISLASKQRDAFTADHVSLMKVVAGWVGSLVQRSELSGLHASQASEQARRSAAEELITVVAHDLRNMLSPIVSRMQVMLLRAQQAQRSEDAGDCERVLLGLQRVTDLMTDLLDVPRIERGLLSITHERLDLVELVQVVARTLAPPGVEIQVETYVDQLMIIGDRERLGQALSNVVSNAVKHSPPAAAVSVELTPITLRTGKAVKITIVDQGSGIAPELLPRIFERYVADGPGSGLGLGLYLSRAVLAAHGGTIAVTSNPPWGTRCEIQLPLMPANASSS